ncbi:hypothetical protein OAT18_02755 [Tenacibaculum sp.]|nr:hypothetical protein [Tenacibaculum sp.]
MKKNNVKNKLKLALFAIALGFMGVMNAQTTTGDITQQTNANLGTSGTAVKLVDNKGTIKYMQAVNGLTSYTNTTPNGGVITTWQLGGTLTDDTYITADGTNIFALDGLELVTDATTASSNAVTLENHDDDAAAGGTGFTVIIRDEDSGAIKKIQLTDLLKVEGIRVEHTQGSNASANVDITVTGLPTLTAATTAAKLFVYRNGVKLRFGTDFSVTADTVTITYSATDLPMYTGDIVEVQYIK